MSRKRILIVATLAALVAVWWLGREPIIQGRAISVWAEQFRTGNEQERQQASGALIDLGPQSSRVIADLLCDEDSDVQMDSLKTAHAVLDQCRNNFETRSVIGFVPGRNEALRATRIIGDALLVMLKDNDSEVRFNAAMLVVSPVFGELSDSNQRVEQALPVLAEMLSSENPAMRKAAVQSLGGVHLTVVVPLLLKAVMHEDVAVSSTAIPMALTTIAYVGLPESHRQLAQSLVDRMWSQELDAAGEETALVALGRIGGSRSVMLLLEELNVARSPSREETRRHQIIGLSLRNILDSQDPLDGLAAERDRLKVLLTSKPRLAASSAIQALVRVGPEGWEVIESVFEQSDARMQQAIAEDLRNLGTDAIPDALTPIVSRYYGDRQIVGPRDRKAGTRTPPTVP